MSDMYIKANRFSLSSIAFKTNRKLLEAIAYITTFKNKVRQLLIL